MMNSILFFGSLLASCASSAKPYSEVCSQISGKISSASQVYHAGTLQYASGNEHWMSSSSQSAACVVEVGSNEDTAKVLKIVGRTKTPFGIKSGGHSSNPGYSSTPGVQISMTRFNQVKLSADKSTVRVGLGNVWTDVYSALQGTGRNVNGGRVDGPGTGGFTLGGGYSWFVNQYGLTCDTVKELTLVLPNGTITQVGSNQPDLLFALRGGLNRFGIVTEVTYKTIPQVPMIYGGIQLFGGKKIPALLEATQKFFDNNEDDKAQVILTLNGGPVGASSILLSFFDGPDRPVAFKPYDNIKPFLSGVKTQTYESFSKASPTQVEAGHRGAFHSLSTTKLKLNFLKAIYNETQFYSKYALLHGAMLLSYDIEPFSPTYGKHATNSSYPHSGSPLPLNLYFSWTGANNDAFWRGKMVQSVNYLIQVAKKEGIYSPNLYTYPNYALDTYTGDDVYGPKNAARLRAIRDKVDPHRVMELAGGFKL